MSKNNFGTRSVDFTGFIYISSVLELVLIMTNSKTSTVNLRVVAPRSRIPVRVKTTKRQQPTQNANKRRRNRRRRNRNPLDQNDARRTVSRAVIPRPLRNPAVKKNMSLRQHIANSAFLKCAFAGFDNMGGKIFKGVPDSYAGNSLAVELIYNTTIQLKANTTTFLWFMPSAGIAYFTSPKLVGKTGDINILTPTYFPLFNDTNTYIDNATGDCNFSAFRMAAHNFQLTNTTPMLNRGGTLNLVHYKQTFTQLIGTAAEEDAKFAGNPPTNSNMAYVDDAMEGVTSYLSNEENEWLWKRSLPGNQSKYSLEMDYATSIKNAVENKGYVVRGFDNEFTSCVLQITAPGVDQTFALKVSQCMEMRIDAGTPLETMVGPAEPHDPLVMEAYKTIKQQLPNAMRRKDNGNFWDTIRLIINRISTVASYFPGPVGLIAAGISQLTTS